ncbi:MAG: hypothetical protein CSA38_02565 [Flavobacteriales bacterium]|nr:MAG: hypothetical protein CSA38_02565 [Flavobacteriales bacterium]
MDFRKIIYEFSVLILLGVCISCIPEREPPTRSFFTKIPNLVSISPLQDTYQKGEEITLKAYLDTENTYFNGKKYDVYEITQNNKMSLDIIYYTSNMLISGNELTFIKGGKSEYPNIFYMTYNPNNHQYELEIKIKLNRVGGYALRANTVSMWVSDQQPYWTDFKITTNIVTGGNEQGVIRFIVLS